MSVQSTRCCSDPHFHECAMTGVSLCHVLTYSHSYSAVCGVPCRQSKPLYSASGQDTVDRKDSLHPEGLFLSDSIKGLFKIEGVKYR